ncbi:MAG: ribonuclease HI [Chloroflexota bacterium]
MPEGDDRPAEVRIYTDGACSGNPGPGGWGVVLIYGKARKELSGGDPETTNNRMELTAAIAGLTALKRPCRVDLYTDSQYLSKAFNEGWIDKWGNNGWLTANKQPVLNQDLWEELLVLCEEHEVNWRWVKGHADNAENNRCDELARLEIKRLKEAGKS